MIVFLLAAILLCMPAMQALIRFLFGAACFFWVAHHYLGLW